MRRRLFAFLRNAIILITIAAVSGCSMFRGFRELPNIDHTELRRNYLVIVETNTNEVYKFKIQSVDSEYIIGKRGVPKIKMEDIKKLEVHKTNPVIVAGFVIGIVVSAIALLNFLFL